ncbi:4-(cytidine 5'-diphospho)-2-C-methyl-D-erythritol kinase [Lapidilactobacillus luobeiensis]|uniref:4-(cytidine 5'-diphospho)-2-C-methyl-D-erythritol kinase n=1 Tax=Lapidilactobacillus luobeiensis TaxID=2950371 RepID=UPI0021C46DE1|nr:4-(cytidine 5'-diphospho)-2-C-methyl-D-erythritol kinase [Lapidilactobacillus luobeiensis]
MEISERAPAKVNLALDALYRHNNGAEEWRMILISVDLADTVRIKTTSTGRISVRTDNGFLPVDQRNLAYQAAALLKRTFKIKQGAQIEITKKIPVSAGLGGGSADAAAVLRGLDRLWALNQTKAELATLALKLDSDVPYCLYSTPAVVLGQGDSVKPLALLPDFWVIIVKPQVSVSTTKLLARAQFDQLTTHPDLTQVIAGLQNKDWHTMAQGMANSLEEVTFRQYPQLAVIKQRMLRSGALVAQMSGTGPTMFALAARESQAKRIYNAMRGFCDEVYLTRPVSL